MRTIVAGVRTLRRAPLAAVPMAAEGLLAAALVLTGGLPATGASAPAGALFPLDVYFDLKQSLAFAADWWMFVAAMALALLVRSFVLGLTLWWADGSPGSFSVAWGRALVLAAMAAVVLVPSAALLFAGTALRYAPFVWAGGAMGLIVSFVFARRAARLDVGAGVPQGKGVPEGSAFYGYALLVTAVAAAMSVLARNGAFLSALLLASVGPVHALYILGWRSHLEAETYPGGGVTATALTAVGLLAFGGAVAYDRYLRDPAPVSRADARGSLLILGGVDSTARTGALAGLDPRDLGFSPERTQTLSYRAGGGIYGRADTRRDLDETARIVAGQIAAARPPRVLLGHSQAALVLDRVLDEGLSAPEKAVSISAPPPVPPRLELPDPGEIGRGRPGGDLARALGRVLDIFGAGFEVGGPHSPSRLRPVVVGASHTPRLAVWALGDSVWLDRDWRRPGELNVVAISDHVGATNDARALEAARAFIAGRRIDRDEGSWRGLLAAGLRYLFEPWRPA
ncbi:MAG: hypothetical protein ABR575_07180 [Actinomycetota bacterium]